MTTWFSDKAALFSDLLPDAVITSVLARRYKLIHLTYCCPGLQVREKQQHSDDCTSSAWRKLGRASCFTAEIFRATELWR